MPEKIGLDDFFADGGKREDIKLIPIDDPLLSDQETSSKDLSSPFSLVSPERLKVKWPKPPKREAFYGLAGEFITAIEPHSEADPIALLIQFLVAFGNIIGRNAHFTAEAAQHFLNLFCVLVGETSKGRKGTSWAQISRPFQSINPTWALNGISSGLSSGEGLIWAVRDPIEKMEPVKDKGRIIIYQPVQIDPGISDKRLLILESEFALGLRVLEREGNTLSAIIRQAWDTGTLRTLTKNNTTKATGAHISIIGHITKNELLRYLNSTETANGFGNRFLWTCARRSKILPEGGCIQEVDFAPLVNRLRSAVNYASKIGEMKRNEEARKLWAKVYPELSEGKPGLFGALTARAEAQVMRLACLYALLDQLGIVEHRHLESALALWEYLEVSVQYVFGDSLGDPVADTILSALEHRTNGLTRTDISGLFGRHVNSAQITRALNFLSSLGVLICENVSTAGRSSQVWKSVAK